MMLRASRVFVLAIAVSLGTASAQPNPYRTVEMPWVDLIAKLATITTTLVGAVGVIVVVHSYRMSVRLKRAEWLQKLY